MKRNFKVIDDCHDMGEFRELIKDIPNHWKFITLECDSESAWLIGVYDPTFDGLDKSIHEFSSSLYDNMAEFDLGYKAYLKYPFHIETFFKEDWGEMCYNLYIYGEFDRKKLNDYFAEPTIDSVMFIDDYGDKKRWINLSTIDEIGIDPSDVVELLK